MVIFFVSDSLASLGMLIFKIPWSCKRNEISHDRSIERGPRVCSLIYTHHASLDLLGLETVRNGDRARERAPTTLRDEVLTGLGLGLALGRSLA